MHRDGESRREAPELTAAKHVDKFYPALRPIGSGSDISKRADYMYRKTCEGDRRMAMQAHV